MTHAYQDIPPLLHDARLQHVHWEPELGSLSLYFYCLMRNIDGSTIADPIVELQLTGVERIAAYYSPASITVRPSEFLNPAPMAIEDFHEWRQEPCEVFLSINSHDNDFKMATSCEQDWLFGKPNEIGTAIGIHLTFDRHFQGNGSVASGLYFGCDFLESKMAGVPLSVDEWRQRFNSWWEGWQEHWDRKDSEPIAVFHESV